MAEKGIKISYNTPEKEQQKRSAVALRYDIEKDAAPLVLATGRGRVADEILRIAQENEIPLYEDPRIAGILSKLKMDTEIPPELYVLVAGVLFFVFQLDKMAEKKQQLFKKLKEEKKR